MARAVSCTNRARLKGVTNQEPAAPGATARRYHDATKHSPRGVAADRHALDWANQPLPFKVYPTLEPIELPIRLSATSLPAIDALRGGAATDQPAPLDLAAIARLCPLSNGVTRIRRYPGAGGELAFRAAGTTGALYHVELSLACADLPDLPAGVYHFGAHDNALRRLRAGDHRELLIAASGAEPALVRAPVIVVATSTYWRNAWKYRARAWRHTFWDTGTVLANLLALARAADLPAHVVLGFADAEVSALLDVDPTHEGPVCLVALGSQDATAPPAPDVRPLHLATAPLSEREVRYPLIEEAQAASSLATPDDAAAWRGDARDLATPPAPGPMPAPSPEGLPTDPIERVIQRRGSTRRFARRPIPADALTTLLEIAAAPVPIDAALDGALLRPFLIVNSVHGLEPGTYATGPDGIGLERLRAGDLRSEAGWAALGQELAADASVNLYWLADLDRVLGALGDRGYRAAQLEAAIRAGRCWLAAYALRLGATGLTFFDDEAIRLFATASDGLDVMFLLAVGVPAARR